MDVICPNCGAANRNTSHFCAKCGQALPPAPGSVSQGEETRAEGGLNLPWLQAVQDRAVKQTGGLDPGAVAEAEAQAAPEGKPTEAQAPESLAVETPPEGAPPQPGGEGTSDEAPPDWVVGILEPSAEQKPGQEQSYEPEELDHIMPWLAGPPDENSGTPTEPGKPGLPPWLSGITVQETLQSAGMSEMNWRSQEGTTAPDAEGLGIEGLEPFMPPGSEGMAAEPVDARSMEPDRVPDWVKPLAAAAAAEAAAPEAAAGAAEEAAEEAATPADVESSPHTGGLAPTGTLMAPIERNIPVRAPRPGSVETLAALLQAPMGEAVGRPVPGVTKPAAEGARRRASPMQWLLPDGLIYIVILAALMSVLLVNPPFGEQNASGASDAIAFYNEIEKVATGKPVLLAYDWDASRSAEMSALSEAVTHHLMMRRLNFVTLSMVPQGPGFAQMVTDEAKDTYGYRYGRDYIVLGYLPGNEAALRSLVSDFTGSLPLDHVNARRADTYSLLQPGKIRSLEDFGLVIDLSSDETALRNWIEQVSSRTDLPIIAAVPQGLEPLARPYKNVQGATLNAVLSGQMGAMRYIQQITARSQGTTSRFTQARLAESLNALSVAQIIVALVILASFVTVGTRRILRR